MEPKTFLEICYNNRTEIMTKFHSKGDIKIVEGLLLQDLLYSMCDVKCFVQINAVVNV